VSDTAPSLRPINATDTARNAAACLTPPSVFLCRRVPDTVRVRRVPVTAARVLAAQNQSFGNGNFSFSLSPKVLKDGSILDAALGWRYTANSAGTLRVRFSTTAKNEQFDETVPDSLVAREDSMFETFLTPFEYAILNKPSVQFKVGGGLYYNYYTLTEKGFFDMPILEQLSKARVNSFSNESTIKGGEDEKDDHRIISRGNAVHKRLQGLWRRRRQNSPKQDLHGGVLGRMVVCGHRRHVVHKQQGYHHKRDKRSHSRNLD
jgi:hypothetical protein